MYKKDIVLEDWAKILKDFADAVHDKKYKRIDYRSKWSKIAKPTKSVRIEVLEPDISILIDGKKEVIFAINDGAFGEFLYNTLFKEEKLISSSNDNKNLTFDAFASAVDNLIASSNAMSDATTKWAITAEDIAKISDEWQRNQTNASINWNGIESTDTPIDWSKYGTLTPYTYNPIETNKIKVEGTLSTRSYDDVDTELSTRPTFNDVKQMIKEEINNNNEEKKEMKGFNFDFGPCTGDQVRMSMYGLAVKNAAGTYVSYNPKSGDIIDVDILNFDGSKFMYKIPVAIKDIAIGDIIIHNRKPMFVTATPDETTNTIICVDVCAGEQKMIIPTTNMFGFNYIIKIVSFFNTIGDNAPTPDTPFGNMLPFMLMDSDETIDPIMMMLMMGGKLDMSNPMMMYFMFKDNNKESNLLPLMFMMQNQNK